LGDGLLEALSASGIVKAQEAMLAAADGESTGRLDVVLVMRYRIGLEATRLQVASARVAAGLIRRERRLQVNA
jgi:hypothetical protein